MMNPVEIAHHAKYLKTLRMIKLVNIAHHCRSLILKKSMANVLMTNSTGSLPWSVLSNNMQPIRDCNTNVV